MKKSTLTLTLLLTSLSLHEVFSSEQQHDLKDKSSELFTNVRNQNGLEGQEDLGDLLGDQYCAANLDNDFDKVRRLFVPSGRKQKQEELRHLSSKTLYSEEMSYIHEPFWSYNIDQLRDYGKRLIARISPCFIDESAVNTEKGEITVSPDNVIKYRKIHEFGRVLPLLFVKNQLEKENSKSKAVPRLFIVPKHDKDITFDFFMPFLKSGHRHMTISSASNPLRVESDDFDIYQEYIEGEGIVGDHSFIDYGHTDLNAKQIITSKHNGKKYLIDTKESKNFFIPPLNPFPDSFSSYWKMKVGRLLPQDKMNFQKWQKQEQRKMLQAKALHYPLERERITVNVGYLSSIDMANSPKKSQNFIFDDGSEREPYFKHKKDNLPRYLKIGRYDLFLETLESDPHLSIDGILESGVFPYQSTPVSLGINLLAEALITDQEKDSATLVKILKQFVSRSRQIAESEHVKLINLIAHKDGKSSTSLLSYDEGWELLKSMLKKRDTDSQAILNAAILHGDPQLLDGVLSLFSDGKIIEASLKGIMSPPHNSKSKNLSEDFKLHVIKRLLSKLSKVSKSTVETAYATQNHEIIDLLFEKDLNYGHALYSAIEFVKEPHLAYIRWVHGDRSPVDYYWYELVNKILANDPQDKDIDKAIAFALVNSKSEILSSLLSKKPMKAPKTDSVMKDYLSGPYAGESLFEESLKSKNLRLVKLFLEHNKKVSMKHFRLALDTNHSLLINLLIQSDSLEKIAALREAITYKNKNAIALLAPKVEGLIPGYLYQKAFKEADSEMIAILKEASSCQQIKETAMSQYEVDQLFERENRDTIEKLVESEICLGHALFSATKQVKDPYRFSLSRTQGKANPYDHQYWYDLVSTILGKNPPAEGIDAAIAHAFMNSKVVILKTLLEAKPAETPKTNDVLDILVVAPYQGQLTYEKLVKSNNRKGIDLFLKRKEQRAGGNL